MRRRTGTVRSPALRLGCPTAATPETTRVGIIHAPRRPPHQPAPFPLPSPKLHDGDQPPEMTWQTQGTICAVSYISSPMPKSTPTWQLIASSPAKVMSATKAVRDAATRGRGFGSSLCTHPRTRHCLAAPFAVPSHTCSWHRRKAMFIHLRLTRRTGTTSRSATSSLMH